MTLLCDFSHLQNRVLKISLSKYINMIIKTGREFKAWHTN